MGVRYESDSQHRASELESSLSPRSETPNSFPALVSPLTQSPCGLSKVGPLYNTSWKADSLPGLAGVAWLQTLLVCLSPPSLSSPGDALQLQRGEVGLRPGLWLQGDAMNGKGSVKNARPHWRQPGSKQLTLRTGIDSAV